MAYGLVSGLPLLSPAASIILVMSHGFPLVIEQSPEVSILKTVLSKYPIT